MRIKKNINTKIADNDLIKIKRQARIYKMVLKRIINVITLVLIILGIYYYRNPINAFLSETKLSYQSLYNQFVYINNSFCEWYNKKIDSVEITGLKYVDKQDIVSTMYTLDINDKLVMRNYISDIHSQILEIPIIESALVRRILWQNKIIINIKEKSIIAVVKNRINNGKILLLDENGNTISYILSNKFDHLPIIEDSEHPEKVIPIYRYLKDKKIDEHIYGFAMVSDRRWNIRFKNNLIIKLPAKDWKSAIDIMLHIDERVNLFIKENAMTYIDLRIPGKIFLK